MNLKKISGQLFNTGFFHIFGGGAVSKIIQFLSSVILVRILTRAEYGVFTYAWNIYNIIILASGLGMEAAVLQLCSERYKDKTYTDTVFSYGLTVGTMFNLCIAILMVLLGIFAPLKIWKSRSLLCMLSLLPAFQYIYGMISVNLRYERRNQEYAKLLLINTSIVCVASSIASLMFRERGLVAGYYLAYIISLVIGCLLFHVHLSWKAKIDKDEKRTLYSIALVSMCNNALSQLLYLLDVFVIGILIPNEEILAGYKNATLIPTALTFIPLSFITYIYPYFAEHIRDGKWCIRMYKKILLGLGGMNLVISTILFLGAPMLIRVVFGETYMDIVPIFRVLSLNYFISGTFRIISGNLLVSQRKLKMNLIVSLTSSVINILADYFFIQWKGAIGAAYATVLVVIVSSILSTLYLIHTFLEKYEKQNI